jgi:predicted amidophosphoribosyltransferase
MTVMNIQSDLVNGYRYYYWLRYIPVRFSCSEQESAARKLIFDFKDGRAPQAWSYFDRGISYITGGSVSGYVVAFIPASTRDKTYKRFLELSKHFSAEFNIFSSVKIVTRQRDTVPGHTGQKSTDPAADFIIDSGLIKGRNVILIDDVITRGTTFSDTAGKLRSAGGARSVTGLFLGKTFNPDYW